MNLSVRTFIAVLIAFAAVACGSKRASVAPVPEAPPIKVPEVSATVRAPAVVLSLPPVAPTAEEVNRQMTAMLGGLDAIASKPDSGAIDLSSDLGVLSFVANDRVGYFIEMYTGKWREQTIAWLSKGTRYESMIRSRLRAAGLAEDLYYLALIESGFSPDAYSSAAAVGLWQFMTTTAKGEGLKVDWWVDERRDPAIATDAAVRHLSWLQRSFGSSFLAAAAYNGGSGRISRGLSRHADVVTEAQDGGEDVFFALAETNYLRQETRDYVPKLIAAALVAKGAAKFGMFYDTLPPLAYDSVRIGPAVPLAAVAAAADATSDALELLNPHILRGITHPRDAMWVRVPVGSASGLSGRLAVLDSNVLAPYSRVKSKSGETFAAVAKRVGVTSKQLAWYNPKDGASRRVLPAGTTILVPSAAVRLAAKDVPDPSIEIYGGSGSRYVVKRGDTLGGIAARFRVSVANIKRLNRLSGDVIRVGQTLRLR